MTGRHADPETRFWAKVKIGPLMDTCWEWTGAKIPSGYGVFRYPGGTLAHRFAYVLLRGPIPKGLVCDHLCRNRACVNPWHIEPVTNYENLIRGNIGYNRHKTHCKHGHEFTPENTHVYPDTGKRRCKTCARRWSNELRARRQEQHPTPA